MLPGWSRRRFVRYPCLLKARVTSPPDAALDGDVINIGLGGAFLRVRGKLEGTALLIEAGPGDERFTLQAALVWSGGRDSKDPECELYGVKFQADERTQKAVQALVERVRSLKGSGAGEPPQA